ncbi:MAG: glycosyltransferase family 2 protein [Tepidiformaceae bacterium]
MNAALILPARDEAESIARVIEEAREHFAGQVIVVDNGSRDETAERARESGATVVEQLTPGYGGACMAGVAAAADCDVFVFMDADGSDRPEDIPELLARIDGGADIALGVRGGPRVEPGSIAPAARFGNWLSGLLILLWTGRRVGDLSPLKAVRRSAFETIQPTEMTYGWTVELIAVAARRGLDITEVQTGYRRRLAGESKVSGNLSGSINAGYRILVVLGRLALTDVSARMAGVAIGLFGTLCLLALYALWLFTQGPSSPAVLVSAWLIAWPLGLLGIGLGVAAGGLKAKRQGSRGP